ncbi:MAG: HIT family protein [Desulfobacteraceae bacterium]|nr:HIT family protein [Desulfobacteraceae bacterium]
MDCLFCKIINGEIPCTKIYENDKVLSFMDISPMNEGHLLVIPKTHGATILELPETDFLAVMAATKKIAQAANKALNPDGINILQLNGEAANQVVPHLHVHIVPRWDGDGLTVSQWVPVPGDMEQIGQIAEKIKKVI